MRSYNAINADASVTHCMAHLSVAIFSLAIESKSSVLLAALILVIGVLIALPPFTEPAGVDVDVDPSTPFTPADFLAAFSARRFCLEAEGAMVESKCSSEILR
jgi:hypothetical protein